MRNLLLLILWTGVFVDCLDAGSSGFIRQGNKYYQQKQYDQALEKYRQAQLASPGDPKVNFNLGDAYYKLENYSEAENAFQKAVTFRDKKLRASTYYNLGNTAYRQGKTAEAIEYYKKSLILNPSDEDAKYNLEYVLGQKLAGKKNTSINKENKDAKNKKQTQPNKSEKTLSGEKKKSAMSEEDANRLLQPFSESDRLSAKKRKMNLPKIPKVDKDW